MRTLWLLFIGFVLMDVSPIVGQTSLNQPNQHDSLLVAQDTQQPRMVQSNVISNSTIQKNAYLNRTRLVLLTEGITYGVALVGLNELWYKQYPRQSFTIFNDNAEWLYMDKAGHAVTAYYVGRIGISWMQWAGETNTRAAWMGGMLGFVCQTGIEVLDGFSYGWGFSLGDMAANTLGASLVIGQQLIFKSQPIVLKYSYRPTSYAAYRPELLGSTWNERMVKDYNGQTYWLSLNVKTFLFKQGKFPAWLNLALGYGADGMIGAFENPAVTEASGKPVTFNRQAQYYVSLDADLSKLPWKRKWAKNLCNTFGFIKIPLPGLMFQNGNTTFLPMAF